MIEFRRLNEAATLNYNNEETKVLVDYLKSTYAMDVSVTGGSRGADIIYSKSTDPVTSFMMLIDEDGVYYLINATEKMMSDHLGSKRWKASNTTKLTYKAARAIKNHELGGYIDIKTTSEEAFESLAEWLKSVGIHQSSSSVVRIGGIQPNISVE
ncbi:hypothetical protein LIS04_217 [Listeria phage LIS04]|nr:hypothetical protein LIS04_217 [Listeria phage LIS04]